MIYLLRQSLHKARLHLDKKGESLVEVLVSIAMFSLCILLFSAMYIMSMNMLNHGKAMDDNIEKAMIALSEIKDEKGTNLGVIFETTTSLTEYISRELEIVSTDTSSTPIFYTIVPNLTPEVKIDGKN